jgi:GT2 family glycosyltransferase
MKVGVVIANHDRRALLLECLESVLVQEPTELLTVVVDNGSSDGSARAARELFAAKSAAGDVLELPHNTGFAHANNVGIAHALDRGCDAVLVLNNDTRLEHGAIASLVAALDLPNGVGMAAPKVVLAADGTIDATGQRITLDGFAKCADNGRPADACATPGETFAPYGAAAFYHRDLLADVAPDGEVFDEDFRLYCEELDLGWRARLRGWSCAYVPTSVVLHHRGGTAGQYSELLAYQTCRNTLWNIAKNYPDGAAARALLLSLVRPVVLAGGLLAKRGPAKKFGERMPASRMAAVLVKGWVDALRGAPRMLRKRRRIQASRTAPPEEVARWFRELGEPFFAGLLR